MVTKLPKAKGKYSLERSPLYNLSNKRKLSKLLDIDLSKLSSLEESGLTSQYRIFTDKNTRRFITDPRGELLRIHKHLLRLFIRIEPPPASTLSYKKTLL